MVTGNDLLEFAKTHSMTLVPGRDAEEFAAVVNSLDGRCPCVEERSCPCDESIQEVKLLGKCTCTFFCSRKYATDVGGDGELPKSKIPVSGYYEPNNPKIKSILDTLAETKGYYEKGNLQKAHELLLDEEEKSECPSCAGLLHAEATRVVMVSDICQTIDGDRCEKELDLAKLRMTELEKFFIEVDKRGQNDISETKVQQPKQIEQPFRACMSEKMLDSGIRSVADDTPKPKEVRFYMSSQICKGAVKTIEDALDSCKKKHPEWFS